MCGETLSLSASSSSVSNCGIESTITHLAASVGPQLLRQECATVFLPFDLATCPSKAGSTDNRDQSQACEALKKRTDTIALENAFRRLLKWYELRQGESQLDSYTDEAAQGFARLIGLPPQEALKHLQFLRPGPRASEDPGWLLSYEVSTVLSGLQGAQFVLWWTNQTFTPALWCPTMKVAFYARALLGGIRICPHCGELFFQDRPDQNYCSVAHREAHRVARWRLQQKQKATGKKEKNVTRKAR